MTDWEQAQDELKELAKQLDVFAFRSRKNVFHLSIKKAKRAEALADRCRRLARRALTLPCAGLGQDQEVVIWEMYERLCKGARQLMAEKRPAPQPLF